MNNTHRSQKTDRRASLLAQIAAEFIARELGVTPLVTVTHATLSYDRKHSTIFCTVYPEQFESEVLKTLGSQKQALFEFVKTRARFGLVPVLTFCIDRGEKNRQRIETLSKQ